MHGNYISVGHSYWNNRFSSRYEKSILAPNRLTLQPRFMLSVKHPIQFLLHHLYDSHNHKFFAFAHVISCKPFFGRTYARMRPTEAANRE